MSSLLDPKIIIICSFLFLITTETSAFEYLQPLPKHPPIPANNPLTKAKITLGKQLFFDPKVLGINSKISCNNCHNLSQGGSDNKAYSIGQEKKKSERSAPGLWNIGFQTVLYWDGRIASLEKQTLDHLRDSLITTWHSIGDIVSYLSQSAEYQHAFNLAFNGSDPISGTNIARAIASFERSLMALNSPFDRYINGDTSAISASAIRGIESFNNSGCLACHFGVNFAGPAPGPALKMGDGFYELFPNNLGTIFEKKYRLADDRGLYEYSGLPDERYMWRVAPLRNIALTAPYFHNGSVATLKQAIKVMAKTQMDKDLNASTVEDIEAFLRSLTGEPPQF